MKDETSQPPDKPKHPRAAQSPRHTGREQTALEIPLPTPTPELTASLVPQNSADSTAPESPLAPEQAPQTVSEEPPTGAPLSEDSLQDGQVVLNYIDKLIGLLTDGTRIYRRFLLLEFLVFIGLVSVAVGVVSLGPDFAFGGITVQISPAIVLVGGAWTVSTLFVYVMSLAYYLYNLEQEAKHLYQLVGLEGVPRLRIPSLASFLTHGFGVLPGTYGGIVGVIVGLPAGILIYTSPLIAVVAAWWRAVLLFGWVWWVWVAFLPLGALTLVFLIVLIRARITPGVNFIITLYETLHTLPSLLSVLVGPPGSEKE